MRGAGYKSLNEYSQIFCKELLWNSIVEKYLQKVEVDEIRKVIGNDIIEENEECYTELIALLDILAKYKLEAQKYEKKVKLQRVSGEVNVLKNTIMELSKSLKKKSIQKMVSKKEAKLLFDNNTEYKPPVRLKTPRARPSSSSSVTSTDSEVSTSSNSSDVIDLDMEKIKPNLNVFNIKKVVEKIRSAMEAEKKLLIEDIDYIRNVMDNEIDYQKKVSSYVSDGIPSVDELVIVEKKMKKEIEKENKKKFINELPVLKGKKRKLKKINSLSDVNNGNKNKKVLVKRKKRKKGKFKKSNSEKKI